MFDVPDLATQLAEAGRSRGGSEGQVLIPEGIRELVPEQLVFREVRGREMIVNDNVHVLVSSHHGR